MARASLPKGAVPRRTPPDPTVTGPWGTTPYCDRPKTAVS